MKICVLLEADIYHLRGEFMAIHNRMKYLVKEPDLDVVIYNIQRYYDDFTNWIRGNKQIELKNVFFLDGIHYHCLYYKRSYLDYFMRSISKYQTTIEAKRVKRLAKLFLDYDVIYAHTLYTGYLALGLQKQYGIPYAVMWHGSSIHTAPFQNKTIFSLTQKVLQGANHNFYVSPSLFEIGKKIAGHDIVGSVSPNGIDTQMYYSYGDEKKQEVAKTLQIDLNKKNVAFIGNYLPIKNIEYLPKLFSSIHESLPNTHFHIIGDGRFAEDFANMKLPVTFWGNQLPQNMPDLYNCMNLVVLPSHNEGLPMTCLESLACGIDFVGSRVGGIADAIGIHNTIPFSDTFETDFAKLCIEKISASSAEPVVLPDIYNVEKVASQESVILKSLLSTRRQTSGTTTA